MWEAIHPLFGDHKPPLSALESVSLRDIPGGTAPNRVGEAVVEVRKALDEQSRWFEHEATAYSALFERP
jgi:hypothetical protein